MDGKLHSDIAKFAVGAKQAKRGALREPKILGVLSDDVAANIIVEREVRLMSRAAATTFGAMLSRAIACTPDTRAAVDAHDIDRCAVCGWPYAETTGCAQGYCSMRPLPNVVFDYERARREGALR